MNIEFKLPELGENITGGDVVNILVREFRGIPGHIRGIPAEFRKGIPGGIRNSGDT